MNLSIEQKEVLEKLVDLNNSLGFPDVYITGGFVRDDLLNILSKDIDITVNSKTKSFVLGVIFAVTNNYPFKIREGNHLRIFFDNFSIDFSSANISENTDENFSYIKSEAVSRDFTINSLLYSLRTRKIIDITGRGLKDIKDKKIDTCMDPQITFYEDPKRIIRSIFYCCKLDFTLEDRVLKFLKNNIPFVHQAFLDNLKYFSNSIAEAIEYDEDKVIDFLKITHTFQFIPLAGQYKNILIKKKLLNEYFQKPNEEQVNDAIDLGSPINAINQFVQGSPSSVPTFSEGDGYKDDNNRDFYRGLPYLT